MANTDPRAARLWAEATGLLNRGVLITMVQLTWNAKTGKKQITPAFNPTKDWHLKPPLSVDLVTQLIERGANAYLYRLPDDVFVVDADDAEAVERGLEHFGTLPAVRTRKGAHWLFKSDGYLELEGTVFDSHQPRQLYGPGSYYDTTDGPALYDGAVPPWETLPAAPEALRAALPKRRVSAGPGLVEPKSGFFATPPATYDQVVSASKAALERIATGAEGGEAAYAAIRDAAFLMGGYLHTGWYTWEEAEEALLAACARRWREADEDDAKNIEVGLTDGDRPTNRLPAEKRVALTAEQVSGAVQGGPFDYGDPAYYASPVQPPEAVYGAFGGPTALLYDTGVHWLQGESGSGKTWVALGVVVEVLRAGELAIIVDYEDTRGSVVERLKALGMTQAEYGRLVYVDPHTVSFGELCDHLATSDRDYALMVVDGVTSSLSAAGLSGRDEQEVTRWTDRLPRQARMSVCVDHVVKAIDDRRGMAIGSQAKKSVVTGTAWEVTKLSNFAIGQDGVIELRNQKDKRGGVTGRLGKGGVVRLAFSGDGTSVTLLAGTRDEGGIFADPNDALFGALLADGFSAGSSANELLKAARDRNSGFKAARKTEMLEAYKAYVFEVSGGSDDLGNHREPGLTSDNAFANAKNAVETQSENKT
jgi:hypothetical protein